MADLDEPSASATDVPSEQVENSPGNPFIEDSDTVNLDEVERIALETRFFNRHPEAIRQTFQTRDNNAGGNPFGQGSSAQRAGPNPPHREPFNGNNFRAANALATLREGAVLSALPRSNATAAPSTSFQSVAPTVYPYDRPRRGLLGSRLSELPRFHGNPSEDKMSFGEWVEMYERLTNADRWSNQDRFDTLPALLRDTAYTIYKNVCRGVPNNYTDVIGAMKPFLRPSLGPEATFKKAYAMNQRPTQTVLEYATEIQHVLEQDGMIASNELEPTKLRAFMGGLREDIKLGMKIRDHEDFMLALADAKQAEQFIAGPTALAVKSKFLSKSESEKFPDSGQVNQEMKDLLAKFTRKLDKITQESQVNYLASQISQMTPNVPVTQNSQPTTNATVSYYNPEWAAASAQAQGYNVTWANEPTRPPNQNFGENPAPNYPPWVPFENMDHQNFQNYENNFVPPNGQNFNGQSNRNPNWSSGSRNAGRNNRNNQNFNGNNANFNGNRPKFNNQNYNGNNQNYNGNNQNFNGQNQNSNGNNQNFNGNNQNYNGNNRSFNRNNQNFRGNNQNFNGNGSSNQNRPFKNNGPPNRPNNFNSNYNNSNYNNNI